MRKVFMEWDYLRGSGIACVFVSACGMPMREAEYMSTICSVPGCRDFGTVVLQIERWTWACV